MDQLLLAGMVFCGSQTVFTSLRAKPELLAELCASSGNAKNK